MKRFKLSRKEKLLFATPLLLPLLLPLLVAVWFLVPNSFERTLRELAGPEAIDCGVTSYDNIMTDPCAIMAFKANKPFIVRIYKNRAPEFFRMYVQGMVRTPRGEVHIVNYYRQHGALKTSAQQYQILRPRISPSVGSSQQSISSGFAQQPRPEEYSVWYHVITEGDVHFAVTYFNADGKKERLDDATATKPWTSGGKEYKAWIKEIRVDDTPRFHISARSKQAKALIRVEIERDGFHGSRVVCSSIAKHEYETVSCSYTPKPS